MRQTTEPERLALELVLHPRGSAQRDHAARHDSALRAARQCERLTDGCGALSVGEQSVLAQDVRDGHVGEFIAQLPERTS